MHLVVESHAKKSIDFQIMLIKICIVIIPILLEIVLYCRIILLPEHDESFHFNDISTDEVYGEGIIECYIYRIDDLYAE